MRFDDSLDTALAADMSGPAAIEWTWRQLVDLIGRRRSRARPDAMARLRTIRPHVSHAARLATARGLERADPPAALVALFVDQELAIAGPVVRNARLNGDEWLALLPVMLPATRGVLRLRGDLPATVVRALAAFGPTDFALHDGTAVVEPAGTVSVASEPPPTTADVPDHSALTVVGDEVEHTLPLVAEAIRQEGSPAIAPSREDFEIPELVARITAHQRATGGSAFRPATRAAQPPTAFRYEADAAGSIRWVEGVERGALIGLSLTAGRDGRPAHVDGVAAGALAHRTRFTDARLEVGGSSDAAGSWRISGAPLFDHASGRFIGYRGTARRPRPDEMPHSRGGATDALRQLVHELRTPANAISGFAEMIERELMGPVSDAYRAQAASIRGQTVGLLDAIDDLDTAARLEANRLDLRSERVSLAPLVTEVVEHLRPLTELRGATLTISAHQAVAAGDADAVQRLVSRFLTALVSGARMGERIAGRVAREGDSVLLEVSRPAGFIAPRGALFEADAEAEASGEDGPLLGTGFAFRLARRLASELGGSLTVAAETLTLRLPAAVENGVELATN